MKQGFGCIICTDLFNPENDSDIVSVPCGHTFHKDCIDAWLTCAALCPICKQHTQSNDVRRIFLSEMNQDNRVPFDRDIITRMILSLSKNLKSSMDNLHAATAHLVNSKNILQQTHKSCKDIRLYKERTGMNFEVLMTDLAEYIKISLQLTNQTMYTLHDVKMMRNEIADFITYCRNRHRQECVYMLQRQMRDSSILPKKDLK